VTAADGKSYLTNGFPLLAHAGSISHEQMEERTGELCLKFDQDRKRQEAQQADHEDEADLTALETKLKRRPQNKDGPERRETNGAWGVS